MMASATSIFADQLALPPIRRHCHGPPLRTGRRGSLGAVAEFRLPGIAAQRARTTGERSGLTDMVRRGSSASGAVRNAAVFAERPFCYYRAVAAMVSWFCGARSQLGRMIFACLLFLYVVRGKW